MPGYSNGGSFEGLANGDAMCLGEGAAYGTGTSEGIVDRLGGAARRLLAVTVFML